MVYFRKGNLLESECDYICHQVNCQGKMNSGIAKQIREKWPIVYANYSQLQHNNMLGEIQPIYIYDTGLVVINMFGQYGYGYDGAKYTSYDAFWNCLNLIKQIVPKGSTIGFPKKIGCVRGGANWAVILEMITEVLGGDYTVYIFDLEGEKSVY